MALFLDAIDSVPLEADKFSDEFKAWLTVLVDNINYSFNQIQGLIIPIALETTSITANVDTNYLVSNAAQTTITCPLTAAKGSIITVLGMGAGGWILKPNTGQTIKVPSINASAGTSITSANQYDVISIQCIVDNTTWVVINAQTTGFTIV